MGYGHRGARLHELFEGILHQTLTLCVESRGGLIEYQYGRILQNGARYAHTLALSAGESSAAVAYGDQLLPALGVTFPLSDTAAYFVFLGVYLAVIFVIYYFLRSRVEVTYALAYDSLRPREPENKGAVLGNIFQM